eukprot:522589_1
MCTKQSFAKWIDVALCPITDYMTVPAGIDQNNYIVIGRQFTLQRISCVYKYNINTDKWRNISGLNNIQNISSCSATLDVKKQILYLFHSDSVSEIQLNDSNTNNYTHNTTINLVSTTKSIILNDSFFIIGG